MRPSLLSVRHVSSCTGLLTGHPHSGAATGVVQGQGGQGRVQERSEVEKERLPVVAGEATESTPHAASGQVLTSDAEIALVTLRHARCGHHNYGQAKYRSDWNCCLGCTQPWLQIASAAG